MSAKIKRAVVTQIANVADGVKLLSIELGDGSDFDAWTPGAHITLHLPNGLIRQYSLCGDPADAKMLTVAVLNAPDSRGGSSWIHESLAEGSKIGVEGPHNHFEMSSADSYLFIAGGIGITPIKAMIESLPSRADWKLIYLGRSRTSMAFHQELVNAFGEKVLIRADDEFSDHINLTELVDGFSGDVYACGPESLLNAIEDIVPSERFHCERFKAVDRSTEGATESFEVEIANTGKRFTVGPDETLLAAIEKAGEFVASSCTEGVCGSCETKVITGEPLHRDSVLRDEDKDAKGIMFPCVSRAKSAKLVLELE